MTKDEISVGDQLSELRKMVRELRTGINRVSAQVDMIGHQADAILKVTSTERPAEG